MGREPGSGRQKLIQWKPEEGRFTRADVDRIVGQTWQNFEQLAPSIPREPTVGNRTVMLLTRFAVRRPNTSGRKAWQTCVGSWCNLDYPLAEMWNGRLERAGTLAGRADRCDFRFIAADK